MGKSPPKNRFPLKRELFDYLLMGLAALLFLNIVAALVLLDSNQEGYLGIRKEAFRMAACWVLLMAVGLASDHLRNWRLAVLVLCTALGMGIQLLSIYSAKAQGAQYTRFELTMSVFSVYFTLPVFIVLLVSTKVDNLSGTVEKERVRLQRLQAEGGRLVDMLKKARDQKPQQENEDDESNLTKRRFLMEMARDTYQKMVRLKFRRDVNGLLEEVFSQRLGFEQGFVLESSEDSREMKVKNVWGFPSPGPELDRQIAEFKDRELSVWAYERREWLDQEKIRRNPSLFEAADRFNSQIFPVSYVIPMVSMNRTANIVYLGAQRPGAALEFDMTQVESYLAALGLVLAKISGKSGKPQFATFGT